MPRAPEAVNPPSMGDFVERTGATVPAQAPAVAPGRPPRAPYDQRMGLHTPRPDCIDVVIEIPRGSRNKYEYDPVQRAMRLDRRLFTATMYPADYGFVPDTLADDGDPLDALVLLEDPTFPGCWVEARPVGLMWMYDEAGGDAKLICLPPTERRWKGIDDLADLSEDLLQEIKHFFDVYKALEPGKESRTGGFDGREVAWRVIEEARAAYPGLPTIEH